MWPEKMYAWASMAEDPLKRAGSASAHPSSPLRRYSPTTLAVGGLIVVGGLSYVMFGSKKNGRDQQASRA
ncbi:hypothetical protein Zm00014a_019089 [Zea mays]|jgi:hypothetical protein|uniref:Uncharacterized protein n=2 Tax=Zea mays TaxID=4577 RepID=B6SGW4_MAIZE|nr:uncharacterized protein LOC100279138 [Zea mays]ACG24097.1 hypothetical protein [Zea mays]ACG49049.1 hypothetical protein [Zea mays]ONM62649.1 hypothetical protein ZEAMMB73_Zm00001d000429 [Zea mays]PWZ06704.1 hypothetical protein Zm00014a_019089 [Zea mays]